MKSLYNEVVRMLENKDLLTNERKHRSSNLELLRIFCMLIIVMHHFALHSGFIYGQELSFNKFLVQGLLFGGKLGVNCFVIISGFFLVKKMFSLKKLLKLLFQVWFYGVTLLIVCVVFKLQPIDTKMVIRSVIPIFNLNWFAETYIILYLMSPLINKLLNYLNRKEFLAAIFLITFCWSLVPSFTGAKLCFSELGWFVYLYMVGAYLRIYPLPKLFNDVWLQLKVFSISLLLTFLSVGVFDVVGVKYAFFAKHATYYYNINSIFMTIAGISLFLIFKAIKINYNKNVNNLALTMFGVYLIHDNPLINKFIWGSLFHNIEYTNDQNLLLHAFWVIPTVFMSCAAIDWTRILFVERPILLVVGTKVDNLQKFINSKMDRFVNKVYRND
jgi:surface polysaccharide O-acyltransferase-like enzyme